MVKSPSECNTCEGRKFIRYDVPSNDERFGRIYPCPSCNQETMYRMAGLTADEAKTRVADLRQDGRPGTMAMVKAAQWFYERNMIGFVALCGGFGVGKSHIMKAIAAEGVRRGWETYYITLSEVLMYIREAYNSQLEGDSDLGRIKVYAECRLLLLDEIDKVALTEYAQMVQTYLLDKRYRRSKTLGTVLAWNGGIDFIQASMPWLASRLWEFVVVENEDSDFRLVLHELNSINSK